MENRFDLYDLPEGHEARFSAKLEGRLRRRMNVRIFLSWGAAAAVLAALFLLPTRHYFLGARTPAAVYAAYLEKVGDLYQELSAEGDGDADRWVSLMQGITEENVPMYEQLPDDLSDREKTAILKRHYGELLRGADQLRTQMLKQ